MPRYIDVEKIVIEEFPLKDHELIKVNECAFFGRRNGEAIMQIKDYLKRMIDNAPTEDVVPRSKVEELKLNHKLRVDRLINECGNQSTLWRLHFEKIYETHKETIKQEVAKGIISEFKDLVLNYMKDRDLLLVTIKNAVKHAEIELKKKYIGV